MIHQIELTEIYAIGDVHGNFKGIRYWIKTYDLKDCAIIFCGDFGLGFEKFNTELGVLKEVNKVCEERNIFLFAIRGNHDDPSYYQGEDKFNLSHFKTVSDYDLIVSPNHTILCLGGAISIDRKARMQSYDINVMNYAFKHNMTYQNASKELRPYYWKDEAFVLDLDKLHEIIQAHKIDVVCSHSAPDIAYPITKVGLDGWLKMDDGLRQDLDKERSELTNVFDYLRENGHFIKKWIYGHFHTKMNETILGTNFILLDMGRDSKKKNTGLPGANFDMTLI